MNDYIYLTNKYKMAESPNINETPETNREKFLEGLSEMVESGIKSGSITVQEGPLEPKPPITMSDVNLDFLQEQLEKLNAPSEGPLEPGPPISLTKDFKEASDSFFASMLNSISPQQNEEKDSDYVKLTEHLGFFEPEIKDNDTYNQLVQAVKDVGHWVYSGPNRIEPVEDGYIDAVQLQNVLNQFEFGPGDFFRGSITLWGIYEHNSTNHLHPNYLEVIYIEKIEGRFKVVQHVLKDGTTQ